MTDNLKRVHETELKILKEIDRICRKHRIRYMLDAGTLLGAVRHQGFIPWDDDADLAFTRKNYEKFLKIVRQELPDTMELITPDSFTKNDGFFDFTARIIYKRSRVHEDSPEMDFYEGKLNHLWVDLFTLDELPANPLAAQVTLLLHKIIYGMAMGHRYRLDYSKYSLFHKLAIGGLAGIGRLVPMKVLFRLQRAVALKDHSRHPKVLYYSNYQPDYLYVKLKKSWCDEITNLPFEDTKLMASKHWDEVLTWIYGDYMTPPPEDQRVPAHSTVKILIDEDLPS
ncbi:MAG: LicD family protein [Clostridiales bacterium]|nr:LicD family protein [Clostridiales bacterium]